MSSTGCRTAASTSPTSASIATRRATVASTWRSAGSGGTGRSGTSPTAELCALTNRFANVLDGLGVARGDRVFVLTDRIPELYVSVLGTLKHGSVACTLFSAFGPEPIRQRLTIGDGRVLVTTERSTGARSRRSATRCPRSSTCCSSAARASRPNVPGTVDYSSLMDAAGDEFDSRGDDARRHGAAALHQRHDRYAEGRGPRARGGTVPIS